MPNRNKICLSGPALYRGNSQADTSRCPAALFFSDFKILLLIREDSVITALAEMQL